MSGRAETGDFLAIMGPSGSGKVRGAQRRSDPLVPRDLHVGDPLWQTSLLDCLSLRVQGFNGGLRLDGKPVTGGDYCSGTGNTTYNPKL